MPLDLLLLIVVKSGVLVGYNVDPFLMAEDLNGYFSSVFTSEDISSLPVPDAKFQEDKPDYQKW